MAIHTRAHFCKVRKIIGCARHQLLACLRNGLTAIACFGLGNGRDIFGNEFPQLAHDLGAICGGCGGPFGKGSFGCGHRLIDFIQAAR